MCHRFSLFGNVVVESHQMDRTMDAADQTKRKRTLSDIGNLQDQKRSKGNTAENTPTEYVLCSSSSSSFVPVNDIDDAAVNKFRGDSNAENIEPTQAVARGSDESGSQSSLVQVCGSDGAGGKHRRDAIGVHTPLQECSSGRVSNTENFAPTSTNINGARTPRTSYEPIRLRFHDHFSTMTSVELANLVIDHPVIKESAKQFFNGEYNGTLSLSYSNVKKRLDFETILRVFGDQCHIVNLDMSHLRFNSMDALKILANNCVNVHQLQLTECNLLSSTGYVVNRFIRKLSVLIIHKCIITHFGNTKINAAAMYTTDTGVHVTGNLIEALSEEKRIVENSHGEFKFLIIYGNGFIWRQIK